ncbi:MAG: 2-succinyl-5-enolpyruvyl-6-hydroxy-3-cyclohexene-1-carboxylic-acid synthase [Ignavibacteria bacterium]|nr:2-succinyl-5-enolpyruvyl-6-hydroxy-3-cyclohexene-1-carboxylic-acid synthase [Ignavibacteria bacterium]MBT8382933.1 2-succinyl-5-enolpyruvyl-6-hydroxy-3-cyclohexene-1-carboxylic-acid synthase [Ignavibacteria bacterium]MBT8391900.1 2-succinyl-5-enolpyruvyl-6-hydroxy-3-cyclohexene-1-carboxylic-acid synthase [Ignavibacteria bacterium]NNJ53308.1 2-succinyl-5-enolpyruvyl-6-hydroxy-3-cyclohexene-1-carboxylic-acid synthase [Ignavibacteriaceae bacterium]NNL22246.1 2-succinyl-5-enolpyruvyl-6-hydroxy-3
MKIKINKNHIWANTFVNQLAAIGVKLACMSPGSRSTPLIYSLAENKKIKCFVNIDERSSAYFALGLAKASGTPVVIVTTSGTATAELYPAIIEAYQQRTPLIICTADRPPELVGTGANQTITQHNIYRNHIRLFRDVGLPSIKEHSLNYLQKIALKAFKISVTQKGPVHINFPFAKPLEPFSLDNEIDKKLLKSQPIIESIKDTHNIKIESDRKVIKLAEKIVQFEKGLIIAGPMENDSEAVKNIIALASLTKYPLFADGVSYLRFKKLKSIKNIISNYNSFLTSKIFCAKYKPDLILHFGGTPTSANLLNYLSECDAERFQINEYGDLNDPSRKTKMIFKYSAELFSKTLIAHIKKEEFIRIQSKWLNTFTSAESISEKLTSGILDKEKKLHEPKIITELLKVLPSTTNLFIGNSLPIRDFDCFSGSSTKKINLYFNRGASGIDGLVSTALGVASIKEPTVLLVGDLSFLHDLNSLLIAKNYNIPLLIIVINNNGGGIFKTLPISKKKKLLRECFIAPQNMNTKLMVEAFGINYRLIKNKNELKSTFENLEIENPLVLEIQTSADESANLRNEIFSSVKTEIENQFS